MALETIKTIEENDLINRSRTTGEYFNSQLNRIKLKYPGKIKEIRARGLMLAVEFNESVDGEIISRQLFEDGFVTGYKLNTLRFLPPLIIKNSDIDKLIGKLDEILKK